MEYIKVTDALRCLSDALDNRKEYLGNFLDQYGLFNLTVYVSKDDGKSLEKNAVETKLLHDWIRTRYPVQSLMQTKFVSPYHSPKVQQAIINAMHSDEFSTEYQHYWEKDTFYSNRIFDLINNKPEIVGYQFGMNTDEITASTIQNLNDQLKNQADEIATLQARITKLDSELNQANTTPANLKGLEKVNYDKAKAKLFAQIVAKSIWDMDTTEQIKSGDMVQYVKSLLLQFDDDSRPQTDEVISDWLRDIKPNYAKQSGRPPKNTPNEIPLTFKK